MWESRWFGCGCWERLDGSARSLVWWRYGEVVVVWCSGLVDIRVEVCDDGALTLGDGDILMSRALDDGERYVFLRHYDLVSMSLLVDAELIEVVSLLTGW